MDVGSAGGNLRASAGVEIAVITIHTSGVSITSESGSSRKCQGLGRRVRRSERSGSGSGPTSAGGDSGCDCGLEKGCDIGQRCPWENRRPTPSWIAVITRIARKSTYAMAEAYPPLKNWKACT